MCWARVALAAVAVASVAGSVARADTPLKVLARDVRLDDAVLVLKIPASHDGTLVQVVVVDAEGMWAEIFVAREGEHVYDLRRLPEWRGRVRVVGTTLTVAEGVLRRPTLGDEIDSFLEPEPLLPATVNLLRGHHVFGVPFERVLLLVFAVAAGGFYFVTRRFGTALLFGFCLAWVAADARTMLDHADVVQAHEAHRSNSSVFALGDAVSFAIRAEPVIGDGSWTADPSLNGLPIDRNYLVGYALAERRYVPNGPGDPPADFVVTGDPTQGTVVVSQGALYLIKRGAR